MEQAFAELPLALFTTLAPAGACAFVALFFAQLTAGLDEATYKKADKFMVIPLIVAIVGLICSFFHLASPAHALGVMKGIGSSPLSNEICTAIIFVVLALIYWLIALTGKLPKGVRTVFGAIVALAGLVFSVFCGMAYQIETIASWCGPWTVVSMVGVALFGGVALCDVALACAGGLRAARQSYRTCAIVLFLVGLVVGFGGMGALVAATAGLASPLQSGGALVSGATPAIIAAVALGLIAAIGAIVGLVAGQTALQRPFWPAIIALIALFAILFARLVFYALQLGIGLN